MSLPLKGHHILPQQFPQVNRGLDRAVVSREVSNGTDGVSASPQSPVFLPCTPPHVPQDDKLITRSHGFDQLYCPTPGVHAFLGPSRLRLRCAKFLALTCTRRTGGDVRVRCLARHRVSTCARACRLVPSPPPTGAAPRLHHPPSHLHKPGLLGAINRNPTRPLTSGHRASWQLRWQSQQTRKQHQVLGCAHRCPQDALQIVPAEGLG